VSVVTFIDYTPPPRFDGTTWTEVKIQESASESGPWTVIDTQPLYPVDDDPKHPQERSFTTDAATLDAGWYIVSFYDEIGNFVDSTPTQNLKSQNYYPTVRDVASMIMSRTKDQYGNLLGTFTEDTTPTAEQVEQVTERVITEVADVIGDQVPSPFIDDARHVAALRVAMQVELDFFSDQVNTGRSIYPQLREQYLLALQNLQTAISSAAEGEGPGTGATVASKPEFWFPPVPLPPFEVVVGDLYWPYRTYN